MQPFRRRRSGNQQHELAAGAIRIFRQPAGCIGERHPHDLLEELGDLPGNDDLAGRLEGCGDVGEGLGDSMGCFVEHQRAGLTGQPLQAFAARGGLGRQEAFEHETIAGQPGHA